MKISQANRLLFPRKQIHLRYVQPFDDKKRDCMTKAQLKKHLQKLPKEQVIEVILELYDARKEAKEYLDFYTNPNEDAKLEE